MDLTARRKQKGGKVGGGKIEADHSIWRGGEAELKLWKLDGNIWEEEEDEREG